MTHQRTQSDEQANGGSRIRQVVLSRSVCLPARSVCPARLRALHPDQIEAVNQAFAPSEADYARAVRIIEAYAHATTVQARGAVMLGEEMIDEASRKIAEVIVARGGRLRPKRESAGMSPDTSR
jgi:citrate lyase beta subunit